MNTAQATAARRPTLPAAESFTGFDYALYGLTVFAWSASWYALKLQVGVVPNEVSLVWRFLIAAIAMWIWALAAGHSMRFPLKLHLGFAGLGVLIFSSNFLLFYYGAQHIVSGLLSVVFSTAFILNLALAALVGGERPARQTLIAGLMGATGVALMFASEFGRVELGGAAALGLMLCVGGTLSFSLGNLLSARLQREKISLVAMNAWGMSYGVLWSALLALVQGKPFIVEWTASYLVSLVFLAIVSTVVAFAAYLTLLGRIGPARAGYATVMFPVVALAISTVFEGYVWTIPAAAGLALVLAGNWFVIRRPRRAVAAPIEPVPGKAR